MIKQPFLALIGLTALVIGVFCAADRAFFLSQAEHTSGTVIQISSSNARCGGGRRRRSYDCTKYQAKVQFYDLEAQVFDFNLSAGSARGHDQPNALANYQIWQKVPVVYSRSNPKRAYHDSIFGIWGYALGSLGLAALFLLCSFAEPRQRRVRSSRFG